MRVLHVYKTYFPDSYGGLERAIYQICRATSRRGVENRIFTLSKDPQPRVWSSAEAEVHRYPLDMELASCGVSLSGLRHFGAAAKWADIIHYHFPWPFGDLMHFVWGRSRPTLVTYHSDIVRQTGLLRLYRPLLRFFLCSMDTIVATSPNYLRTSTYLKAHTQKTTIVPLGLDPTSYPPVDPARVRGWRDRLGENFFLFVGVLRYYKGLHLLLEAVAGSDLKVVIVGAGPTERELKEFATRYGIRGVEFLGFLSEEDKVALLELCLGIAFPSHLRSEAFGVSLLEGAMFGKPLISSEIGTGTSFVNVDGETGLVVPPNSAEALRAAMLQLQSQRELAQSFGRQARQRFDRLFSAQALGDGYVDVYRALLP